jgi:DNA-binding helix-hairpin-helix protein with protein kinase domain
LLAANGILTAADVDQATIREIKGFGYVLTSSLLGWKDEVLRQFRFDPGTAVSAGQLYSLAAKFRVDQQKILAELERRLGRLESLTPACRAQLQALVPSLQNAVAAYQQADADLQALARQ